MVDPLRRWYERLALDQLLAEHAGLRIVPSDGSDLRLWGELRFQGPGEDGATISDSYEIEMCVPPRFPDDMPFVREHGQRIPSDFHKLTGNWFCLGAPTAIRLKLREAHTLPAFIQHFVIPYLYGHAFFARYGRMPYGELMHGDEGIRQYLAELFGSPRTQNAEEFLRLAGMKKGIANKFSCPCGSGKRLGRCHHRRVNHLRRKVGRTWFRAEYERVLEQLNVSAVGSRFAQGILASR